MVANDLPDPRDRRQQRHARRRSACTRSATTRAASWRPTSSIPTSRRSRAASAPTASASRSTGAFAAGARARARRRRARAARARVRPRGAHAAAVALAGARSGRAQTRRADARARAGRARRWARQGALELLARERLGVEHLGELDDRRAWHRGRALVAHVVARLDRPRLDHAAVEARGARPCGSRRVNARMPMRAVERAAGDAPARHLEHDRGADVQAVADERVGRWRGSSTVRFSPNVPGASGAPELARSTRRSRPRRRRRPPDRARRGASSTRSVSPASPSGPIATGPLDRAFADARLRHARARCCSFDGARRDVDAAHVHRRQYRAAADGRPPHLAGAAHRRRGRGRRALGRGGHAAPPRPHRRARAPAHGHHGHRRAGTRARARASRRAAGRRAAARQGHLRHGGRAHDVRLGDLPRQRAGALGDERAPAGRRRRDHARQGQPARVRLGRDVAQPRLRRRRQQRAPRSHPGRLLGRQRERARGRPVRARARHRHGRLDPAAGRGLRRGRLQAGLRQRARPTASGRSRRRSTTSARSRARSTTARWRSTSCAARRCRWSIPAGLRVQRLAAADVGGDDRGVPRGGRPARRRPPLVRLHLAEVRRGAPRDLREPPRRLRRRPPRQDGGRLRRVARRSARRSSPALHAWRAACARACEWDVLVSPAFPGELPPADMPGDDRADRPHDRLHASGQLARLALGGDDGRPRCTRVSTRPPCSRMRWRGRRGERRSGRRAAERAGPQRAEGMWEHPRCASAGRSACPRRSSYEFGDGPASSASRLAPAVDGGVGAAVADTACIAGPWPVHGRVGLDQQLRGVAPAAHA